MNMEVITYGCHELRNDAERNDLLVDGFLFGTIPNEAAVEGYDEASMLLQFKLFGKRKNAIKRTTAGKDNGQPLLLSLNKNPLSIRCYGFACGEQSAIEVCSKEAKSPLPAPPLGECLIAAETSICSEV